MEKTTLKIFGNVLDVLEGRVSLQRLRDIEAEEFRFALGAVTFSHVEEIGDGIVLDGLVCETWEKEGNLSFSSGRKGKSPFLMGIDRSQPAGQSMQRKDISLEKLYGELAKEHPLGFALAGSFRMAPLKGIYLKKPPIYGENINRYKEAYWSSVDVFADAQVSLFGVVIPQAARRVYPKETLERGFYLNPMESGQNPYDSHTHAALVEKGQPYAVRHVLSESVVGEGTFVLYTLGNVVAL